MGLGCEIVNWNYFTFPTDVCQLYFRKMLHFHSFSMYIVMNHTMFHPSQAGYSRWCRRDGHLAGRPACGPYGIAMGHRIFIVCALHSALCTSGHEWYNKKQYKRKEYLLCTAGSGPYALERSAHPEAAAGRQLSDDPDARSSVSPCSVWGFSGSSVWKI